MTSGAQAQTSSSPRGPGMTLADPVLQDEVSGVLQATEELLAARLSAGEDFVAEPVMHLLSAGGKRFRPLFCALAAQFGEASTSDAVIRSAAVVEMIHLATLYHDDVMDEAPLRRGVESANARWTNSVAILSGDYLFAAASAEMAEMGAPSIRLIAQTFAKLVTGQMRETIGDEAFANGDVDASIARYLQVIDEKTGCLIEAAGRLGAMHAAADADHVEALGRFGAVMGQVFQIVDDIIDVQSATAESGKTPGTDLREGVFTLPVLYALQDDGEAGAALRQRLTGPVDSDEEVAVILELIARTDGRERALRFVGDLCDDARAQLHTLPACAAREALDELLDYSTRRVG